MANNLIASRYITAFVNNIVKGKETLALEQVIKMGEALSSHHAFYHFVRNPALPFEVKSKLLRTVATSCAVDVMVLNLFLLLLQKKRLLILEDIVQAASHLICVYEGRALVGLEVPQVFCDSDLPLIQSRIEDVFGPAVLKVSKNNDMIGGFKATCGFKVIDGSVENCLNRLSATLS